MSECKHYAVSPTEWQCDQCGEFLMDGKLPSWFDDVREFHRKFGVPVGRNPRSLPRGRMALRDKLELEEDEELTNAVIRANAVPHVEQFAALAKETCDLIYVLIGRCVEMGIDLGPVWDAVHASNMTKTGDKREDGKILKGEDYVAPDIEAIIREQMG